MIFFSEAVICNSKMAVLNRRDNFKGLPILLLNFQVGKEHFLKVNYGML